jgi:hypothetical protein
VALAVELLGQVTEALETLLFLMLHLLAHLQAVLLQLAAAAVLAMVRHKEGLD